MDRQPTAATLPILALVAVLSGRAAAADVEAGRALAERWCAGCHVVGTDTVGTDAAPAFPSIARRHGDDLDWARGWLSATHPRMPDLHLSRAEIDDLVAYLLSLLH
ncbi:c-type cytochrome [Azospirillum sp. ST 5-10]|uniref:c-type cytochrome n=1 Tax=unclassified Azospirillum TaxID=2630922 RepID=UPI003F49C23C